MERWSGACEGWGQQPRPRRSAKRCGRVAWEVRQIAARLFPGPPPFPGQPPAFRSRGTRRIGRGGRVCWKCRARYFLTTRNPKLKLLPSFSAVILLAALQSACVGPDAPKLDDRIHGSVGTEATSLNTSRIVPERPYNSPNSGPSTSSAPSGPVLIPGSSN